MEQQRPEGIKVDQQRKAVRSENPTDPSRDCMELPLTDEAIDVIEWNQMRRQARRPAPKASGTIEPSA